MAAGAIFLLSHPVFAVSDVRVLGLRKTPRDDLEQIVSDYLNSRAFLIFRRDSRFLFNASALESNLADRLQLASAQARISGDTLEVRVQERSPNLLWQTGGNTHVVDLQGIVVREASPQDEAAGLPLFIDLNDVPVEPGSQVSTRDEIGNILEFQKLVGELGIRVVKTSINRVAGKWISLATTQGYEIYFDASGDIAGQASHLATLLSKKSADLSTAEYIDLRFGDQIYYKKRQ